MKTGYLNSILLCFTLLLFISCKKEGHDRDDDYQADVTLDATVKSGVSYKLNLSQYGNGATSISQQAASYSVSKLTSDASGNSIYEYVTNLSPKTGGSVTDKVVLNITTQQHHSSGGCHNNGGSTVTTASRKITINFSATE